MLFISVGLFSTESGSTFKYSLNFTNESNKQQHRDSNGCPAEEGNLLHHFCHRAKHMDPKKKD